MSLQLCRRLAMVFGIFLPVAETYRRWNTGAFWWWFDDFLIGVFLLYGAWYAGKNPNVGRYHLAAAYAFSIGIGYGSVFGKLQQLGGEDVIGLPTAAVVSFLGPLWLLAIWAMTSCLRAPRAAEGH